MNFRCKSYNNNAQFSTLANLIESRKLRNARQEIVAKLSKGDVNLGSSVVEPEHQKSKSTSASNGLDSHASHDRHDLQR